MVFWKETASPCWTAIEKTGNGSSFVCHFDEKQSKTAKHRPKSVCISRVRAPRTQGASVMPPARRSDSEYAECCKTAMFKYSDKQHLGGLESAERSSPWKHFGIIWKRTWWQQLWLSASAETCLFEAKNCNPHYCHLPSKFQDFPIDLQDFPGPGNFPIKIPGLSRRCVNAGLCLVFG